MLRSRHYAWVALLIAGCPAPFPDYHGARDGSAFDAGVDAISDVVVDEGSTCAVGPCSTGDPCQIGLYDCSSGTPVCMRAGNAPGGTLCPGGTCDDAGTCVPCTPGVACTAPGGCATGTLACDDAGMPSCTVSMNAAAGATCPIGLCNDTGQCLANLGAPQDSTITVPPGVLSMRVRAWGAGGGEGTVDTTGRHCVGGFGGYVETIVDVVPGEVLRVVVGGAGTAATMNVPGTGGIPGGGGNGGRSVQSQGGGGGGFSGVFRRADPLAIAGGGGGGASSSNDSVCPGGSGGGTTGGDVGATGTTGGTSTAGGGTSGGCGATAGTALQGGAGGGAACSGGGGGGGGGLFGGGGGAGVTSGAQESGGGGSGYATGTVTLFESGTSAAPGNASSPLRVQAGDREHAGRVVITMPGR